MLTVYGFINLQVSRSIGDAYLKKTEFNREPLLPKFRLPEPFQKPILKAEPSIFVQKLYPEDQFLVFASDGLWEHLSSQEAVDIVNTCPRNVGFLFIFLGLFISLTLLLGKKMHMSMDIRVKRQHVIICFLMSSVLMHS